MIVRDYLAPLRHEEEIADYAQKLRSLARLRLRFPIDVVEGAKFLMERPLPLKGRLGLLRSDHKDKSSPAYVTFDPLTLHVDEELWTLATLNDDYCRFVLAHELGHVILHNKGMQPYSGKVDDFTAKSFQERSAEWQADVFACHFLAPDELARLSCSSQELCTNAVITIERAEQVLSSLNCRKIWSRPQQIGDVCDFCGNFTVFQNSIFMKCVTCRTQTFK